jgi:hypothetical protein
MTGANDITGPHQDDLIVVLVGLTATWGKRRRTRRFFRAAFGESACVPWIPYFLGLRASAAWASLVVRRRLVRGRHARLHLVAYIGGGVLARQLHARGVRWPIGRAVWDRGPAQEQVSARLAARVPAALLTLIGQRSVVDISRIDIAGLPFPPAPLGAGLIVESRPSALARRLGIADDAAPDLAPEQIEALLPGATGAIVLPLSHDEVYDDPRFLDQAASFLKTGSFRAEHDGASR